jgi:chemotaxis protein CheY-P-specific phosphatase CheC
MGIPREELAVSHTSDEVGNVLGELMNQMIGDFISNVGKQLLTPINQNQPKMLTINKEVLLSINTNLDRPQARRVTFTTQRNNIFYLELAMDKTEFIQLHEFEQQGDVDPDDILEGEANKRAAAARAGSGDDRNDSDSLLDELGI